MTICSRDIEKSTYHFNNITQNQQVDPKIAQMNGYIRILGICDSSYNISTHLYVISTHSDFFFQSASSVQKV